MLLGCDEGMVTFPPGTLESVSPYLKKLDHPVQCSEFTQLAGDPSVMRDDQKYTIFYTGLDKDAMGGGVGMATSADGTTWTVAASGDEKTGRGLVLRGRPDTWEHQLETASAIKRNDTYFLYYCGYPKVGWPTNPGQIGLATSKDGINFKRVGNDPVLKITPRGYDTSGLYSPSVIHDGTQFVMVYAGHCYPNEKSPPTVSPGIYLLGATSNDGVKWTKRPEPVLAPAPNPKWLVNGVAEPEIVKARDGRYYLFYTANLGDDETRLIAVAKSKTPFGPWDLRKTPLLTASPHLYDKKGVLAPTVLIEGDKLRMWYLTSDQDKHMTGYAEMPWPIADW